MEPRVKRSVSIAIPHADGQQVLIVQRPADDEDLPNAWGLPAASLRDGESWTEAAQRAGHEKLGVELQIGREINRGAIERSNYKLEMRLFEAEIVGVPEVPQSGTGVTQYQSWRWGTAADLEPASAAGSLCCGLYIQTNKASHPCDSTS